MDKEKLGKFVATLRREQNMTQKDLAEKLCLTDKAISKWERGLSYPDISMLEPMAEILGVTVLELLRGERIREDETLTVQDAHEMIEESLNISDEEIHRKHTKSKNIIILCCITIMFFVSLILNIRNVLEKSQEDAIIQNEALSQYEMHRTEDGEIEFADPVAAIHQILEDCRKAHVDETLIQYLEMLEKSMDKVVK
ncbi:MAG: helix-turn-helix domain-containing protein [Wujia sp.]